MVTPGVPAGRREPTRPQPALPRHAADGGSPARVVARLALFSALACGLAACAAGDLPEGPPPTAPAVPKPAVAGPRLTALEPALGSTGGGTPAFIRGTGFQAGTRVTLGGVVLASELRGPAAIAGTLLYVETPAHVAGAVDLVVTNPDGQTDVLVGGFTYAAPASFAVDGDWQGWDTKGVHHYQLAFTIRDGVLTKFSCEGAALPLAAPVPVRDGAFAYVSGGPAASGAAAAVAGRIVAPGSAVGTVTVGPCVDTAWSATADASPT
jgi:hypothetical protein